MSPLHYAALYGQTEVAQLLLEHGADVRAKVNKETPLDMAQRPAKSSGVRRTTRFGSTFVPASSNSRAA